MISLLPRLKVALSSLTLISQLLTPTLSYADVSAGRRSLPDFYQDHSPTATRKIAGQAVQQVGQQAAQQTVQQTWMQAFTQAARQTAIQSGVSVTLRAMTQGDMDLKQVVLQGAATAAASGLASLGAKAIGDLHQAGDISDFSRTALHGGLAFGLGAASNVQDPLRGGIGGTIGAITGEIGVRFLPGTWSPETRVAAAGLIGTTAAVLTGQDPISASLAAINAAENNSEAHKKEATEPSEEGFVEGIMRDVGEFFTRPPTPPSKDTLFQRGKTYAEGFAPDWATEKFHQAQEWLGEKAQESAIAWQRFESDPSLENWSTKHAVGHVTFEALDLVGTGYEYGKAYARRGLRGYGMGRDAAQDIVSCGDVAFMATGVGGALKTGAQAVRMVSRPLMRTVAAGQNFVRAGTQGIAKTLELPSSRFANAMAGETRVAASSSTGRAAGWDIQGASLVLHPDWHRQPIPRGEAIEVFRGHNLPKNFKTIDRFDWDTGTAVSIKSRDLGSKTYLDPKKLELRIKKDIDTLAGFEEGKLGDTFIDPHQVKEKILDIAIPHNGNSAQQEVFRRMTEYARSQGIKLKVEVH